MRLSTLALMMLFLAAWLTGCGDSHEAVADQTVAALNDLNEVLAGVTDKATADAAKPKIDAAAKQLGELKARAEALGQPSDSVEKDVESQYGVKAAAAVETLRQHILRISVDPMVRQAIGESLDKAAGNVNQK